MIGTPKRYGNTFTNIMFIVLGYICRRLYGAWRKVRSTTSGVTMEFGLLESYWGHGLV